jgi:hypothetical protein
MADVLEEIRKLLASCSSEQRKIVFMELRKEFSIHPIEERLNTQAEIILEAISRDTDGLTFRMLRGVIAEAAFEVEVLSKLKNWNNITPDGDLPYDYLLEDNLGNISLQVKLQRSKEFKPMSANEAYKRFSDQMYVVETQKTRGGIDTKTGEDTRPYRFGEFDILAVSLYPSTNDWSKFIYTVGNWLLPDEKDASKVLKFQPISKSSNDDWTDNFEFCVDWFRKGITKKIRY